MSDSWRVWRAAELRALSNSDPSRIIGIYRHAADLDELRPLPPKVSFTSMIEMILDHEEEVQRFAGE
jgi:hypothetical protein